MKVNTNIFVKSLALITGLVFFGLSLVSLTLPAAQTNKEPDTVFDVRCVALDPKTGSQKTVFEKTGALDFTTSSRDGDVVFTLFFSKDRSDYELVQVEKNMLCTVNKRLEVR